MLRRALVIIPLKQDQAWRVFASIQDTLNAIVYGTLAIAVIQGVLTAIAFALLGISSPVLWGLVTSLCAILPVIGTAFVFLPAIGMLAVDGHWVKSLILLAWAIFIVHPVDNVLRPYLIGGRTWLSMLYIFFALLGGVKAFGSLGIFLGPTILAGTTVLLKILSDESRTTGPHSSETNVHIPATSAPA